AVILRGNLDFASGEVLYGLIGATMAEFKFEGLSAQRLSQDLVSETNPKNRHPALDEIAHSLDGVTKRRRVARPIGEENPRGFVSESLSGRGGSRHNLGLEAMLAQTTQDVVFHPIIVCDDRDISRRQRRGPFRTILSGDPMKQREARALLIVSIPEKWFLVRNLFYVIHAHQPRPLL